MTYILTTIEIIYSKSGCKVILIMKYILSDRYNIIYFEIILINHLQTGTYIEKDSQSVWKKKYQYCAEVLHF